MTDQYYTNVSPKYSKIYFELWRVMIVTNYNNYTYYYDFYWREVQSSTVLNIIKLDLIVKLKN